MLVQKGVLWYENVNIIGTLKGSETWFRTLRELQIEVLGKGMLDVKGKRY